MSGACISLYLRHQGVQQFGLFASRGVDLLFQGVAQSHQLVYAGDDAVLFGEGGGQGVKAIRISPIFHVGRANVLALGDNQHTMPPRNCYQFGHKV